MYYLMNKDNIVGSFNIEKGIIGDIYNIYDMTQEKLPIGFTSLDNWIENRKAYKHNHHLKDLMVSCGCDTAEGFIKITHSASINDTFWIKSDKEDVCWKDISFYRNEFNETISKLAFEGIGLCGIQMSTTSPELSTSGSFRKCWKREDENIYLYKRGRSGARNVGLEPYGEMMASELAEKLCPSYVQYKVVNFHGEIASKCELFTDEQYGYAPYANINEKGKSIESIFRFYENHGEGNNFRRMMILDALTFNTDRHMGNHGMLFDNDTLELVKMAPIFDLNLALLPYAEKDDFEKIEDKIREYFPCIGSDFTRDAQQIITSDIRSDLIGLKGFQFSFRGDNKFPEWRVKALEALVNKQIEAILSKEKLYTKDVFISSEEKVLEEKDLTDQIHEAEKLGDKLIFTNICANYEINMNEDNVELWLYPNSKKDEVICVNISDMSMWIEINGNIVDIGKVTLDYPELSQSYCKIAEIVDNEGIPYTTQNRKNINTEIQH